MSDPAASVFISHCAADKDLARQLQQRLKTEVDAQGAPAFDPLLDFADLEPGTEWREELYSWMQICDAAVILVSPGVAESRWLPRESLILRWRSVLDKTFRPIIVLLDGLKKEALNKDPFAEMGLDALQFIEGRRDAFPFDRVVESLRLAPRRSSGMPVLAAKIAEILSNSILSLERLRSAAEKVEIDLGTWRARFQLHEELAIRLAHFGFTQIDGRCPGLEAMDILLGGINREHRDKLWSLMEFSWVHRDAAAILLKESLSADPVVIVLPCENPDTTPDHYLARAWADRWKNPPVTIPIQTIDTAVDTPTDTGEAIASLRRRIYEACPSRYAKTPEQQDRNLRAVFDAKSPYIFRLGREDASIEELIKLKTAMPYVTLFYVSPHEVCEGVHQLKPLLTSELEQEAMSNLSVAYISFQQ